MNDAENDLMSVTEAAGLASFRPVWGHVLDALDDDTEAASMTLAKVGLLRRKLAEAELVAVRQARSQGVTWRDIGHHLGMSAQAAHQRFSKQL